MDISKTVYFYHFELLLNYIFQLCIFKWTIFLLHSSWKDTFTNLIAVHYGIVSSVKDAYDANLNFLGVLAFI